MVSTAMGVAVEDIVELARFANPVKNALMAVANGDGLAFGLDDHGHIFGPMSARCFDPRPPGRLGDIHVAPNKPARPTDEELQRLHTAQVPAVRNCIDALGIEDLHRSPHAAESSMIVRQDSELHDSVLSST